MPRVRVHTPSRAAGGVKQFPVTADGFVEGLTFFQMCNPYVDELALWGVDLVGNIIPGDQQVITGDEAGASGGVDGSPRQRLPPLVNLTVATIPGVVRIVSPTWRNPLAAAASTTTAPSHGLINGTATESLIGVPKNASAADLDAAVWKTLWFWIRCPNYQMPGEGVTEATFTIVVSRANFRDAPATDGALNFTVKVVPPIIPPAVVVAVTAANSLSALSGAMPNLAFQQSTNMAALALVTCEFRDDAELDFSDNPFGTAFGPDKNRDMRSSIVTFVGAFFVLIGVMSVLSLLYHQLAAVAGASWASSRAKVAWAPLVFGAGPLCIPPLTMSGIALMIDFSVSPETDVVLAIAALSTVVLATVPLTVVLTSRRFFHAALEASRTAAERDVANVDEAQKRRPDGPFATRFNRLMAFFRLLPRDGKQWRSTDEPERIFVEAFGYFFDDVDDRNRAYFLVDLWVAIVANAIRGTRPKLPSSCRIALIVLTCVLVLSFAASVARRPFRAQGTMVVTLALQGMLTLGTLLLLVSQLTMTSDGPLAKAGALASAISGFLGSSVAIFLLVPSVVATVPPFLRSVMSSFQQRRSADAERRKAGPAPAVHCATEDVELLSVAMLSAKDRRRQLLDTSSDDDERTYGVKPAAQVQPRTPAEELPTNRQRRRRPVSFGDGDEPLDANSVGARRAAMQQLLEVGAAAHHDADGDDTEAVFLGALLPLADGRRQQLHRLPQSVPAFAAPSDTVTVTEESSRGQTSCGPDAEAAETLARRKLLDSILD